MKKVNLICLLLCLTLSTFAQANFQEIQKELEAMFDQDQGLRRSLGQLSREERLKKFKEIDYYDSLHQIRAIAIIREHGWLGRSQVGQKANTALFLIIQHADMEAQKTYWPLLYTSAEKGESQWYHSALMEDRILMHEGKKQKYGSQAFRGEDDKMYIWPIEDPARVNELRAKMGIPLTVEQNAARLKAVYDPELEIPKNEE